MSPDLSPAVSRARRLVARWIGDSDASDLRSPTGSVLGWNIVGVLTALLGLSVLATWVLSSYYGVNVPASTSFLSADAWCSTPAQGIGVHCFGDFAAIQQAGLRGAPTGPEAVYPLASRLIRLPFYLIGRLGFQPMLISYLVVSAAAMLVPVVWAIRYVPLRLKPIVAVVAGLATMPFLVAWDRGNLIALAVPLLFLLLIGLLRDKPWLVVIATVLATSIKPQFALAALALIALRRWIPALVALVASAGILIVPYFAYGAGWLTALRAWLSTAATWSTGQSLLTPWPVNISFPELLSDLVGFARLRTPSDAHLGLVVDVLVAAVVVIVIIAGRRLPPLAIGIVLLVVASFVGQTAFAYYAVIALPVFAILFRSSLAGWARRSVPGTLAVVFLSAAVILALTPLLIPSPVVGPRPSIVVSALPIVSTAFWALFIVTVAVWALTTVRQTPKELLE